MLKVASCDSQGAVYIADNAVYRLIDENHAQSVSDVLEKINETGIEGVIRTGICASEDVINAIGSVPDALVLEHEKIAYISYPHEWCGSMLKDAALFHLDLSQQLFNQNLFLKDAHPWNILFEKGRPVFVDFTSIVSRENLFSETYLDCNKLHEKSKLETHLAAVIKEIFERMYFPYFVAPISAYAFGQRSRVKKAIENTTLNASTSIISIRDCLPALRPRMTTIANISGLLKSRFDLKKILKRLVARENVENFYQEMRQCMTEVNVEIAGSSYSEYYKLKGEDSDFEYSEGWNAKQKSVYHALNIPEINTVLDVACNTGWFTIVAEKLNKRVVAFDIDEACIESLYKKVKKEKLNILPLVMNFTALTQDRYSICDGKKVLINAPQRLRSDSVIALGIIHHLILGLGLTFDDVLDQLIPLCEKQLVIEFVDASDAVIQDEPSFFPSYDKNRSLLTNYKLSVLIDLCKERGFDVQCEPSYPSTRTIVVCRKSPAL